MATESPTPLKLAMLDLGGCAISTAIFYAYDFLDLKLTALVLGTNGAYVAWRRFVVKH